MISGLYLSYSPPERKTTTSWYLLFDLSFVLYLFTGCSVFGPQTVRKCLFHCTPASLVSSSGFLDRLQKGRAVVSDEGLCHNQPVSVPSDSGNIITSPSRAFKTAVLQITCRKLLFVIICVNICDIIAYSLNQVCLSVNVCVCSQVINFPYCLRILINLKMPNLLK